MIGIVYFCCPGMFNALTSRKLEKRSFFERVTWVIYYAEILLMPYFLLKRLGAGARANGDRALVDAGNAAMNTYFAVVVLFCW